MNFFLVLPIVGYVLRIEAGLLLIPAFVSLLYGETRSFSCFLIVAVVTLIVGMLPMLISKKRRLGHLKLREGFVTVAISWIMLTIFGALPFYYSGYFGSYIDCVFEAMSGFTTTGSSILANVELLSQGMIFWRSFTHWIGGMGVLVFALGFMSSRDPSNIQLLRAESPGPTPGKLVPRLKESARITYSIYLVMTLVQVVLLCLVGLPLFDSLIYSMGSAGTGGFSSKMLSMAYYNNVAAEVITTVFMLLFGVNFNIYYYVLKKQGRRIWENEELRLYFAIAIASMVLIAFNIMSMYGDNFLTALRHSSFQVSTIMTTTGYASTDFNLWPTFSKVVLLLLMIVGACAGSTGGGVKVSRILILFKTVKKDINGFLHPQQVRNIKTEHRLVGEDTVRHVLVFFFAYMIWLLITTLLISLDGYDLETTLSAVISAIGNIGPALGEAGPMSSFGIFSDFSKVLLTLTMLLGRLEIFPVLLLFMPSTWKKAA